MEQEIEIDRDFSVLREVHSKREWEKYEKSQRERGNETVKSQQVRYKKSREIKTAKHED